MNFEVILVALNSLEDLNKILEKSFNLADKFNSNIEILYVEEKALFDVNELIEGSNFDKDLIKQKINDTVKNYTNNNIPIFVKISDTASRVWDLARDRENILIVTKYNQYTSDIIANNSNSFLILKDIKDSYQKIAVVINSLDINNCISLIKENISNDIELIYNFDYTPYIDPIEPLSSINIADSDFLLENGQEEFNKLLKKLNLNGKFFINNHLEEEHIANYINNFDLIVGCELKEDLIDTLNIILNNSKRDIFIL